MEELKTIAAAILAILAVRALLWIAGSLLVGKLTDILLCRALKRIARRTSTSLDEQLIDQLHRPIFITVVLIGLYLSLLEFDLEQTYRVMIASLIQTVGVVVWVGAAMRITTIGVEGLYRLSGRVAWIESAAIPLFSNNGSH
jgi:MscS family membrane protein